MTVTLDFRPVRLERARAVVEEAHPGTADAPRPVEAAALVDLRREVAEAAGDEAALTDLGQRLSPRLVRGLVQGLEQWDDLRPAVLFLLRMRLNARLVPLLWAAWQRKPEQAEIRSILRLAGDQFGWTNAVAAPYAGLAPSWVGSEQPGLEIQRWLDEQSLTFTHLGEIADRPIRPDSPLGRLVLVAVLTEGSRNQLHQEAERLPEWHQELDPELRILFGQNYLRKMPEPLWDRTLLNRFRETYGLPKKPRVKRFWEPVPQGIRERFQRLFIEEEIREAFRGDAHKDREEFWRGWAGKIVDVERKTAGEVPYAYIEFEKFVVFEFFETGHAAYFYLPGDGARMRRVRPSKPRDLKEKKTRASPGYRFVYRDNRLIHNPPWGWHPSGQSMVVRWLQHLE